MNFKTTIGLVVLAIIVALVFLTTTSGGGSGNAPSAQPVASRNGQPLPFHVSFDSSAVTKLTIARDGKTTVLTKQAKGNTWNETSPVAFPLRNGAASDIISGVANLHYVERFIPGQNDMPKLSDVGLKPAKAVLTLHAKSGDVTIDVGSRSVGGRAYIRIKGDNHVYVVSDTLQQSLLDHSDKDWRDKSLSAPKASAASEVILARAENPVELNKTNGEWYIGKQDNQRASAKAVGSLLDSLRTVYIDKFISDDAQSLGLYGLTNPILTLTVRKPVVSDTSDKAKASTSAATQPTNHPTTQPTKMETWQLRIGAPASLKKDKYFATWSHAGSDSAVVFTIDASDYKKLNESVKDLRDPRVVASQSDEIAELTIDRAKQGRLHLVKSSGAFLFGKPKPGYGLDYQAAHDLLDQLTNAKATSYVPHFQPDGKPIATVLIEKRGVGQTEQLHIYKPKTGEGYLCVRDREPVAYRVKTADLSTLFEPTLALRDKTILSMPGSEISQITLKRDDGVVFDFYKNLPQASKAATQPADTEPTTTQPAPTPTWHLRGHKQFNFEGFQNLLTDISYLRVEKWLKTSELPKANLIVLTIDPVHGSPRILKVDPANREGTLTGTDDAFVISNDVLKNLEGEYRSRVLIDAQLNDIKQVQILPGPLASDQDSIAALDKALAAYDPYAANHSGLIITLDSSGTYKALGTLPAGKKVNQSDAADIFDTLAGLDAKRITADHRFTAVTYRLRVTTSDGSKLELVFLKSKDHRAYLHGKLHGKPIAKWVTLAGDDAAKLTQAVLTNQTSSDTAGNS